MEMDQAVDVAEPAARLDDAVRRRLGHVPAQIPVVMATRIKNLNNAARGRDTANPDQPREAIAHLLSNAPNKQELFDHITRLQTRGVKGTDQLLLLLHMLSTDQTLQVLTAGSTQHAHAAVSADAHRHASIPHMAPAHLAAQLPSGMGIGVGATPAMLPVQPMLHDSRAAAPTTGAASRAAAPAPGSTMLRPSFNTPTVMSRPTAGNEPMQISPMQISPRMPDLSSGSRMQETPSAAGPMLSARQQGQIPTTQFNPVYGQEDALTPPPPMRSREYTPSLSTGMAAARMRAAASEARPMLGAVGDLFSSQPPQAADEPSAVGALPTWFTDRLHLTGQDLVQQAAARQQQQQPQVLADSSQDDKLAGMPPGGQEVAVMNDLLYAFMGLDGKYVRATLVQAPGSSRPALSYVVQAGSLQPCSQELIVRLLPICEYVAVLQRFIETRSYYHHGLVSHAVCAAMRQLLADWQLVVTQLEHQLRTGRLSLQGLVFYCQGPLASLGVLAGVAAQASEQQLRGAGLLNLLAHQAAALAGDRAACTLLHKLLHAAATPYFKVLEAWLCEGVLNDPYAEFMVQESKEVGKDALTADQRLAYWSQRYTLRQQPGGSGLDVPTFLQPVQLDILHTGKYLNAMRECGHQQLARPALPTPRLAYDTQRGYVSAVHAAHSHASKALLVELREQQQLLSWLRSLKHFFLLDQGDVVVHLMEAAHSELSGPAAQLSKPRLQSLLELALRTSSLGRDPHAEALLLELEPRSLLELARAAGAIQDTQPQAGAAAGGGLPPRLPLAGVVRRGELCGWDVVQLSVRLQWPLTLVVPPGALAQYQLIFRYLFQLKRAEQQVATAWSRMQRARYAAKPDRVRLRPAYQLAQRQLCFVKDVWQYSSVTVLERSWQLMEDKLRKAGDVDQVIQCHTSFLRTALEGLLLSHTPLLTTLLRLQQCVLQFSAQVHSAWDAVQVQDERNKPQEATRQSAGGPAAAGLPPTGRASSGGRPGASRAASFSGKPAVLGPTTSTTSAVLDVEGPAREFSEGLQALIAGLQELYSSAMRRDADAEAAAGSGDAVGTQLQGLESREEVEALQDLIQKLTLNTQQPGSSATAAIHAQVASGGGASSSGGAVPPPGSNQAIYQQSLLMVAAAEQQARRVGAK